MRELTEGLLINLLFMFFIVFIYQIWAQEKRTKHQKVRALTVACITTVIFCLEFPVSLLEGELIVDLRYVALLVGTMYGGWRTGATILIFILIYRLILGGYGTYVTYFNGPLFLLLFLLFKKMFLNTNKLKKKLLIVSFLTFVTSNVMLLSFLLFDLVFTFNDWAIIVLINIISVGIITYAIELMLNTTNLVNSTIKKLKRMEYAVDVSSIFAVTDYRGVILYVNEKFCEITGYSKEELIGNTHRMINSGYHSKEFWKEMWQTISLGEVWKAEVKNKSKEGKEYWVDTTIVPFNDEEGKPYRYAVIRTDISERKNSEIQKLKELKLAKDLQFSILPKSLKEEKIEIDGLYLPSEELSGDLYFWTKITDNKYGVIIVDVVGHGVTASLISMSIRSLLRGIFLRVQDPVEIYKHLNDHFIKLFQDKNHYQGIGSLYCTALCLLINTEDQMVEYFNAGHPYGVLLSDGKSYQLDKGSIPIGLMKTGKVPVEKGVISYKSRSKIILYTDGFMDMMNGLDRTQNFLNSINHKEDNLNCLKKIKEIINEGQDRSDDISVIAIKLK